MGWSQVLTAVCGLQQEDFPSLPLPVNQRQESWEQLSLGEEDTDKKLKPGMPTTLVRFVDVERNQSIIAGKPL